MMREGHISVLVDEVLAYMDPRPGEVYLDATFGVGGHTRALLKHQPTCRIIALDWDEKALETYAAAVQQEFPNRLTTIWGNFAHIYRLLKKAGVTHVDGVLADFGTSQVQIAEQEGFSIYRDTPLDMRMSRSHHSITAAQVVNTATQQELQEIFWAYGEELHARAIVRAIIEMRKKKPITTTFQLAQLIEQVIPFAKKRGIHPATKVFQALRIYVNRELDNITAFLHGSIPLLNPGGRLVCISFHSLEDRRVKQFFKEQEDKLVGTVLTPKVVVPTPQEVASNPSCRSARLRAFSKNT